jgi:zinc transport system substrate-binding protein
MVLTMRLLAAAAVCGALLPLAGCASDASGTEQRTVVASVYPLEWVAERLVEDHMEVEDLVAPGREPHDAELSVRQTAAIADADLILRVAGLAPAVDDAVAQEADPKADVEALRTLEQPDPAVGGRPPVRSLEGDPHFWLDPRALATYADAIEERLVTLDPQHAHDYRVNATRLRDDLLALDRRMRTGLEDCARRTVVVSHEAYDYLGYRYDLDIPSLVGLSPEDEPSPTTLAALQQLVSDEGVTTVFYEPLAGPGAVASLAKDLGLKVAALDPIEGLTEATAGEDYLSLMRADLGALAAADDCRGTPR